MKECNAGCVFIRAKFYLIGLYTCHFKKPHMISYVASVQTKIIKLLIFFSLAAQHLYCFTKYNAFNENRQNGQASNFEACLGYIKKHVFSKILDCYFFQNDQSTCTYM